MGEGVDVGRWWIVMTAPCAGRNAGGPRRRLAIPEGVGERAAFESRGRGTRAESRILKMAFGSDTRTRRGRRTITYS